MEPQHPVQAEPAASGAAPAAGSVAPARDDGAGGAVGVGAAAAAGGAAGAAAAVNGEEEEKRRRRRLLLLLFLLLLFLTLLTTLSVWYLLFRKPISEILPPFDQKTPPHYMFSVYGAQKPMGVAVAGAGGRGYVTESGGEKLVRVFDGAGNAVGTLRPPTDGKPHTPVYVAVDPRDGDVYVTDRATGAIYIYDASGRYLRAFSPTQPIDAWQPLGVGLSPAGLWWVTDLSAPFHRVEVFSEKGDLQQTIGSAGQFDFPNMVAFDTTGNAYITDSNNGRLVILGPGGQQLAAIGRGASPGNLGLPRGVATDSVGRLYVADATGQFVHIYQVGTAADWRPVFLNEFGSQGIGDGQFEYPNGVAVDSRDRVYVTDRENNRVQVWGY